ncbi:predicted protein [Sclerotinia sclerotiorum 1980 UF-70]|uniref:Uncharacterized protein n=1 Tax=Sclerotinia sclerotiorum (strain ATCC 18683 / 1980 / Ss-1) TaxID=665079 RepID=A7F0Q8_SCLS1|nr:predicted protein [Sclerotinia sclerotiorum 1980 UF-70]EDN95300.1 predicted protein [Sclerotinia sclerotiorum 1980 UF-70]
MTSRWKLRKRTIENSMCRKFFIYNVIRLTLGVVPQKEGLYFFVLCFVVAPGVFDLDRESDAKQDLLELVSWVADLDRDSDTTQNPPELIL